MRIIVSIDRSLMLFLSSVAGVRRSCPRGAGNEESSRVTPVGREQFAARAGVLIYMCPLPHSNHLARGTLLCTYFTDETCDTSDQDRLSCVVLLHWWTDGRLLHVATLDALQFGHSKWVRKKCRCWLVTSLLWFTHQECLSSTIHWIECLLYLLVSLLLLTKYKW